VTFKTPNFYDPNKHFKVGDSGDSAKYSFGLPDIAPTTYDDVADWCGITSNEILDSSSAANKPAEFTLEAG
jgi:hypothetical protein